MFRDARACAITAPAQLARGPAGPSAEATEYGCVQRSMPSAAEASSAAPAGLGPCAARAALGQQALMSKMRRQPAAPPTRRAPPTSRAEDRVSHRDRRGRPRPSGLPCPLRAGAANAGTHILGVGLAGRWGGPAVCGFYCPPCSPGRKSESQSEKKTRRGQQVRFEMLATQGPESETTKVAL